MWLSDRGSECPRAVGLVAPAGEQVDWFERVECDEDFDRCLSLSLSG